MTVDLDKTCGKWHSIHTIRQRSYESAVPGLLQAMKLGHPTAIVDRLVYFARTFRTPRPLSEWVTFGFYDKKLPNPGEVSCHLVYTEFQPWLTYYKVRLDPALKVGLGPTNSQTKEETPAQPIPHRLDLDSATASVVVEDPSRKRKRTLEPPNPKTEPDPQPQPSAANRASERSSQTSQSSKRLKMDCVLITTLPPVSVRKTAPPETSEDEGHSTRVSTGARGGEKQRGKRREAASTSRASARSDSQSSANRFARSRSHSVSSLRRPLFEPVSLESL